MVQRVSTKAFLQSTKTAQNLSSKQIAPIDNMRPKSENAKRHHQWLEGQNLVISSWSHKVDTTFILVHTPTVQQARFVLKHFKDLGQTFHLSIPTKHGVSLTQATRGPSECHISNTKPSQAAQHPNTMHLLQATIIHFV